MNITFILVKWIHVLSMVGAFGGLLTLQLALPESVRNSDEVSRKARRLLNILIAAGFAAGLGTYFLAGGAHMGPHYNGVIGLKFGLLLVTGAMIAMSKRPGRGDLFRTIAILTLALAALKGFTL